METKDGVGRDRETGSKKKEKTKHSSRDSEKRNQDVLIEKAEIDSAGRDKCLVKLAELDKEMTLDLLQQSGSLSLFGPFTSRGKLFAVEGQFKSFCSHLEDSTKSKLLSEEERSVISWCSRHLHNLLVTCRANGRDLSLSDLVIDASSLSLSGVGYIDQSNQFTQRFHDDFPHAYAPDSTKTFDPKHLMTWGPMKWMTLLEKCNVVKVETRSGWNLRTADYETFSKQLQEAIRNSPTLCDKEYQLFRYQLYGPAIWESLRGSLDSKVKEGVNLQTRVYECFLRTQSFPYYDGYFRQGRSWGDWIYLLGNSYKHLKLSSQHSEGDLSQQVYGSYSKKSWKVKIEDPTREVYAWSFREMLDVDPKGRSTQVYALCRRNHFIENKVVYADSSDTNSPFPHRLINEVIKCFVSQSHNQCSEGIGATVD